MKQMKWLLSYSGPDLEIGFNSKYLIDVGGVIEDKKILPKQAEVLTPQK